MPAAVLIPARRRRTAAAAGAALAPRVPPILLTARRRRAVRILVIDPSIPTLITATVAAADGFPDWRNAAVERS